MTRSRRTVSLAAAAFVALAVMIGSSSAGAQAGGKDPIPGMERMHELMQDGNPGMQQMHQQMLQNDRMMQHHRP